MISHTNISAKSVEFLYNIGMAVLLISRGRNAILRSVEFFVTGGNSGKNHGGAKNGKRMPTAWADLPGRVGLPFLLQKSA